MEMDNRTAKRLRREITDIAVYISPKASCGHKYLGDAVFLGPVGPVKAPVGLAMLVLAQGKSVKRKIRYFLDV